MIRFELNPQTIICSDINNELSNFMNEFHSDKIFLLTDTNTEKFCKPLLENISSQKIISLSIEPGENNKNFDNLQQILSWLIAEKASKKSLLINLGGGMITDMGGFAASIFKRGMPFINIPTSLLAQTDASVGGKTGINFEGIKNAVGIINFPLKTLISAQFLGTLPADEFLSGQAEMIKHGLIADKNHFDSVCNPNLHNNIGNSEIMSIHIYESLKIKLSITEKDPFEQNERKLLNFGHTFGHAFEEFFMNTEKPLKHGNAIAHGMICELYVSHKKLGFELLEMLKIIEKIYELYGEIKFKLEDIPNLIQLMHHDKKNSDNLVNCTGLYSTGKSQTDILVDQEMLKDALIFYKQIMA